MAGFSESWLKDYNQRRTAYKTAPAAVMAPIKLKLRRPTVTLNVLMRMHWRARRKLAQSMSSELAKQLPPGNSEPLALARVTITRYSIAEVDEDNLRGCKLLIDCLLPFSARHPHGLGLCLDDDRAHMEQRIVGVVVKTMREQRTEITVEPIPAA